MSTLVFDTLEHADKLKAVGFTDEQAKVQTGLIVDLIETQIVTKDYFDRSVGDLRREIGTLRKDMDTGFSDLRREMGTLRKDMDTGFITLRKDMDTGFVDFRKDMDGRFKELELRMTIRLGTMMVISIGIIATLIKLL